MVIHTDETSKQRESDDMDIRQLDAMYKPFPAFSEWSKTLVDEARWDAITEEMQESRETATEDLLERAQDIVERAAAWDTGAIEGLYETDRGFTYSVAVQTITWELLTKEKGEKARNLFESQLAAYDMVLDFATQKMPIAEAWIRNLHVEICRSQDTYLVYTPSGPQEQPLPKGKYKVHPNHVRGRDDEMHAYAPVDFTPEEMHRLCEELRSDEFQSAHPVLQASYAHYAFVCIHPFADGNGRVARALASVYTYRSHSVPLLILADTRDNYISALEAADIEDFEPFVQYIADRALDGIELIKESVDVAQTQEAEKSIDRLERLYTTTGGHTHEEIDDAGNNLLGAFETEMRQKAYTYSSRVYLNIDVRTEDTRFSPTSDDYRSPIARTKPVRVDISSKAPARASVQRVTFVEVPRDANSERGPRIQCSETRETLHARVDEVLPIVKVSAQMRVAMFVERILNGAFDELEKKASLRLRESGY